MEINDSNRLKRQKIQAYAEGLILAQDLLKRKLTPVQFARKFFKLKEEELFEFKTGLFTPSFFSAELTHEVAQAQRYDLPLCLLVVDMDKLKFINDTHGHPMGDKAITAVGRALRKAIRLEDIPCRWGGDEFTILLPMTDAPDAIKMAKRVQEVLQKESILLQSPTRLIKLTISIGIARLKPRETADALFERADQAVFESKHKGGGVITLAGGEP